MRITRILDDNDTDKILKDMGITPLKRKGGPIMLSDYGLTAGPV